MSGCGLPCRFLLNEKGTEMCLGTALWVTTRTGCDLLELSDPLFQLVHSAVRGGTGEV